MVVCLRVNCDEIDAILLSPYPDGIRRNKFVVADTVMTYNGVRILDELLSPHPGLFSYSTPSSNPASLDLDGDPFRGRVRLLKVNMQQAMPQAGPDHTHPVR